MKTLNPKEAGIRWEYRIGGCLCVGYAALMLCRTTVSVAGPAMLLDGDLQLTKTAFGAILGWGMAGNLLGKLTNGILADRFGGRRIFILAICLSAAAISLFGAVSGSIAFFSLYFTTLFAKSAGWPSMANLINAWYAKHKHGKLWGFISTSSRASSVGATLLLGSLLYVVTWRWLFVVAGGLAACIVLLLIRFLKATPTEIGLPAPEHSTSGGSIPSRAQGHPLEGMVWREALFVFIKSARFWLICISLMCLAVLFEFQVFIPIYLHESFGLSPAQAGTTASIFPLGCLISVFAGGFLYDKLTKKKLPVLLGGLLALSIVCLTFLWALPRFDFDPRIELVFTAVTILIFGFSIAPAYYLPMSVFSIDFGGKHCGFLIGLIDALGYYGAMVFDFVGGSVADRPGGWQSFLGILLGVSIAATVSMTLFLYLDFRASERTENRV